jgi:hypothetical protein
VGNEHDQESSESERFHEHSPSLSRLEQPPPQEFDNQDQPMSFANDNMLRTPEPGFLAPAEWNYSARAATSFGLAGLDVGENAAPKGSIR